MSTQTTSKEVGATGAEKAVDILDIPVQAPNVNEYQGPVQIINKRLARFFTSSIGTTVLGPGGVVEVVPVSEDGELLGFIFTTDNPNMIIEVVLSGDNETYYTLNDSSVADMVAQGRGISPGDATNLPSGESKDVIGIPNNVFPYVSRYKNSVFPDFAGSIIPAFGVMYTPSQPAGYTGVSVRVRNNDDSNVGKITFLEVTRIVYVNEAKRVKQRLPPKHTYRPYVGEQFASKT